MLNLVLLPLLTGECFHHRLLARTTKLPGAQSIYFANSIASYTCSAKTVRLYYIVMCTACIAYTYTYIDTTHGTRF